VSIHREAREGHEEAEKSIRKRSDFNMIFSSFVIVASFMVVYPQDLLLILTEVRTVSWTAVRAPMRFRKSEMILRVSELLSGLTL
jgi:hypothetical protein